MSGAESMARGRHKKAMWALGLFFAVIAVAVFFGYILGKDMAQRDNAHDASMIAGDAS